MKRLLILFLIAGGLLAGCNAGPEPKPEPDPHYGEDITGPDSGEEDWW